MSSTISRFQTPVHTYGQPQREPQQPYFNHEFGSYSADSSRSLADNANSYPVSVLMPPQYPCWLVLLNSTPRISITRDAAMFPTDLNIPSLKKLKKPLYTTLCKTTAMRRPNFSLPDRVSLHLNSLHPFHGTNGRVKHLQTFTKPSEVDVLAQTSSLPTLHNPKGYKLPSETGR